VRFVLAATGRSADDRSVALFAVYTRIVCALTLQHLDLTTDEARHRAYIYASPTVADLNGDGELQPLNDGSR
jgi:hypothetical protein